MIDFARIMQALEALVGHAKSAGQRIDQHTDRASSALERIASALERAATVIEQSAEAAKTLEGHSGVNDGV